MQVNNIVALNAVLKSVRKGKKYTEFHLLKDFIGFHKIKKNVMVMPNNRVVFTPGINRVVQNDAYSGIWCVLTKDSSGLVTRTSTLDSVYHGNYWLSLRAALIVKADSLRGNAADLRLRGAASNLCASHWSVAPNGSLDATIKSLAPSGLNQEVRIKQPKPFSKASADKELAERVLQYTQDVIDMLDMTISILDLSPSNFTSLEDWEAGAPIINLK